MVSKEILSRIVQDQLTEFDKLKDTVPRTIFKKATTYLGTSAFIVKGVRRCGKSTLLKQLIHSKYSNDFYYFNFDEERIFDFKTEDFQSLMEVFTELFGPKKTIFFDEIQNITGWELFINRLLRQGYHIFITGSNATLLSKELGTHLTGRHVDIELYPFSFTEYVLSQNISVKTKYFSTPETALFSKKFKEYFYGGGMPEKVMFKSDSILTQVITDITQRDIINRYRVRKPIEFRKAINFLLANISHQITYRSISNNFGIKSPVTIQKYLQYAEEAYLIFQVNKYTKKMKLLDKNPKKIYCVDNGIVTKNTPSMKEQDGDLLENLVAIQLKKLGKEFYYYTSKTNKETDFVIPQEKQAIQVCYNLDDNNKERELKGLLLAMQELKTKTGLILTLDQEKEIKEKDCLITVKPVWQWLLETES
jgi:uncharacterized protein